MKKLGAKQQEKWAKNTSKKKSPILHSSFPKKKNENNNFARHFCKMYFFFFLSKKINIPVYVRQYSVPLFLTPINYISKLIPLWKWEYVSWLE